MSAVKTRAWFNLSVLTLILLVLNAPQAGSQGATWPFGDSNVRKGQSNTGHLDTVRASPDVTVGPVSSDAYNALQNTGWPELSSSLSSLYKADGRALHGYKASRGPGIPGGVRQGGRRALRGYRASGKRGIPGLRGYKAPGNRGIPGGGDQGWHSSADTIGRQNDLGFLCGLCKRKGELSQQHRQLEERARALDKQAARIQGMEDQLEHLLAELGAVRARVAALEKQLSVQPAKQALQQHAAATGAEGFQMDPLQSSAQTRQSSSVSNGTTGASDGDDTPDRAAATQGRDTSSGRVDREESSVQTGEVTPEEAADLALGKDLAGDVVLWSEPAALEGVKEVLEITELLGEGHYGKVWGVKSGSDTSTYALKQIKLTAEHPLEEARREYRLLKTFNHPNVIKVYEERVERIDNEELYEFRMERLSGGHLGNLMQRHLRDGTWDEEAARSIGRQIMEGLHYIHAREYMHRDIKPENILLHKDGTVRLADFGLATRMNMNLDGKYNQHNAGTPAYMAPEAVRGETYGVAVDMWSAGVTLFLALTLLELIRGDEFVGTETDANAMARTRREYPLLWEKSESGFSVSAEGMDFVRKLICFTPRTRMTAEEALAHPWWDVELPSARAHEAAPEELLPLEG